MIALHALALLALQEADAEPAPFVQSLVTVAEEGEGLLLRDLTGDGGLDLLRADEEGLSLTPLGDDLRYAAAPLANLPWPEGPVGWEVTDLDGDGVHELLTLEPRGVVVRRLDDSGAFDPGRVLLEERAVLPAGVQRVHFVRDVDRDGRADVVLPSAGFHRIFLAEEAGWSAPIEVAYELSSTVQAGDRDQLGGTFGQDVRVPWFRIEDVDGDGLPDLVSETDGRIAFHLASPELSSEPTWILDLDALKAELPKRGSIDFDNLFSFLDERVTWQVADVDGQAPNDLLVVLGSKLRVYLGGSRSGPQGAPDQVLKSSGNVLLTFLRDTGRGALPDLQILRAERISVARVIRSLILPGKLDFDVFTYLNDGGTFGRRPARRNRVTIELPRLIEFMEEEGGIADELEAQFDLPTRRLPKSLSAPAAGDDVVDVLEEDLVIYSDCAPAPEFLESLDGVEEFDPELFVEGFFLEDFDARGDGATRVLDFGDVKSLDFGPASILRRSTAGREPALRTPLALPADDVDDVLVRDLNGDGRGDLIVFGRSGGDWTVQFLIRS